MAISVKIQNLTKLALQDRVLTFTERETIVKAAIKGGISEEEINSYLNQMLEQRLQTYSKADLKSCPGCGGQIPLISDCCPYCGTNLEHTENPIDTNVKISGKEADIIRAENLRTAQQRQGITNCPNCGAPFPLVSRICQSCGHVLHDESDSEFNIQHLWTNIQDSINELRNAPKPSFFKVLAYRADVLLFYFAAAFLILETATQNFGYLCLSFPLLIIAIVCLFARGVFHSSGVSDESPVEKADSQYYSALHNHLMYSRQTLTLYGDDREARRLLNEYAAEIKKIKTQRTTNRSIISVLFLALMAIPVWLYINAPTEQQVRQQNINDCPETYRFAQMKKVLKPLPGNSVYEIYAPYFTVDEDAYLMFDVHTGLESGLFQDFDSESSYSLRIEPVHIKSTGINITEPDTCRQLHVFLWNKDRKPIAEEFRPIKIWQQHSKDNFRTLLFKGKGDYYADFTSNYRCRNTERLQEIADSAYYFTIY